MISIIIPIFNTASYLEQCLYSVVNQTFKDLEIILVDDGSTDNSLEICNVFSEKDNRIKVYHKENSGVSSTRNFGLDKASGDYISFCDSDDIISESLYEILFKKICETDADRVVAGYQYFFSSGRVVKCIERKPDGLYRTKDIVGDMIDDGTLSGFLFSGVNNSIFKRSIIEKNQIRFKENIRYNEDGLFSLEYALHSSTLFSLQSMSLYSYRQHPLSASAKKKDGDIFGPLKEYLRGNMKDVDGLQLEIQLKRRDVTETLWKVLEIAKLESGIKAIIDIHNEIKKSELKNKILLLKPESMNKYKNFYLFLLKNNCAISLFLLSKYILPIASKYLSR